MDRPNLQQSSQGGSKRFQVALSYSRIDRAFVEAVGNHLKQSIDHRSIFLDTWYESELAVRDLDLKLELLFGKESQLIVVFVSNSSVASKWCNIEWRKMREILFSRTKNVDIMIIRLDDSHLEGMSELDGFIDRNDRSAQEIGDLILERVATQVPTLNPAADNGGAQSLWHKEKHSSRQQLLGYSLAAAVVLSIGFSLIPPQAPSSEASSPSSPSSPIAIPTIDPTSEQPFKPIQRQESPSQKSEIGVKVTQRLVGIAVSNHHSGDLLDILNGNRLPLKTHSGERLTKLKTTTEEILFIKGSGWDAPGVLIKTSLLYSTETTTIKVTALNPDGKEFQCDQGEDSWILPKHVALIPAGDLIHNKLFNKPGRGTDENEQY